MKTKKLMALGVALLLASSALSVAACGDKEEDGGTVVSNRAVTVTDADNALTMENGNIAVTVNKQSGNVTGIKYLGNNTGLVHGGGANFSLTVDPTTNDVFKANHAGDSTVLVQSKDFTPTLNTVKSDEKGQIELTYDISFSYGGSTVSGIQVKNTIALERGSLYFTSDYEIANNAKIDCVVVSFTGMQISGIRDENDSPWSLYYPYWEGKIYQNAVSMIGQDGVVDEKLTAGYPSPMSAQLMQLFNGSVSFDYSVLDSLGIYKEFCFGRFTDALDYDAGRADGEDVSMACTQFPFVAMGAAGSVSTVRIGAGGEGSWYEGADRYRDFLISSGMLREKNDLNAEWSGMTAMQAQNNQGAVFATYAGGYANWLNLTEGINTLCALGWYENGFDHMYPDYEFSTLQGGESGFRSMTANLKNQGKSIICDINVHIADEESVWASQPSKSNANLTKIQAGAIKKIGFEYGVTAPEDYEEYMYFENYSGLSAVAMSPASEDFQEAVIAAATRLSEGGANGLWYGQLMERPSYLDYDASHGMKNPATAYSEGYHRLLSAVAEIFDKSTDGASIFVGEGICDAYGKYVDVCGMKWSRKFGTTDTDGAYLDVSLMRYLLPSKVLGIEGVGSTQGSQNEFCRAFVINCPFLCSNYQPSLQGLLLVYHSAPQIYYEGRFVAERGLRIGNEDILAGMIIGSDGSIGLNVYNDSREKVENLRVVIDPATLGFQGKKVASVVNLVTGEFVEVTGENAFAISVNAFLYGAYQIVLE